VAVTTTTLTVPTAALVGTVKVAVTEPVALAARLRLKI
jgi:hypothetical protein